MNLSEFFHYVVTTKEGYFCLLIRPTDNANAWEEWFEWPNDEDKILRRIDELKIDYNVYFSSYLFKEPQSTKENVLLSRTIQADLDDADISSISIESSLLIESSPKRHQGYWILSKFSDLESHEILSRKLTYSIPLCDHSGWALGRKVRVPFTFNHKYLEGPQEVRIIGESRKEYDPAELELLPDVHAESAIKDDSWLETLPISLDIGPNELLETVKTKISTKVYLQYNVQANDRSRALWALICALFRANLKRNQVFWIARNSANNKFSSLRHNGDRELGKDILRAEQVTKSKIIDVKTAILEARKLATIQSEKKQIISTIVLEHLKTTGSFIHTSDDLIWYIRKDLGRPIIISQRSEYLEMILDMMFGLNQTEVEQSFAIGTLCTYALNLPVTATTGALSHYDQKSNSMLLHGGKRDIIRITTDKIEKITNGSYGVIFPWITSNEPFSPDINYDGIDWSDELYGSSLNNLVGIESYEAKAVLKIWTLFLLFRNAAVSRPILALFGQPGSGKSTTMRRIYTLLYGKTRGLGAVTTQDDFDHAVSTDPLHILDNVDTWAAWLPDRLALSASTSDIVKRKLYTNVDVVTLKRQALVGITAHNPKFGREDVADRLLIFNFERLLEFLPEGDIIDEIYARRNNIWGKIILDIQKVLSVTLPRAEDCPQFRVEDFARIGWRIAQALNLCEEFRSALKKIYVGQRAFTLEEEYMLVSAIQGMIKRGKSNGTYKSINTLWTELETYSADPNAFVKNYRNAVSLGKKLWAMQDSLKEIFEIKWRPSEGVGNRAWYIGEKDGGA